MGKGKRKKWKVKRSDLLPFTFPLSQSAWAKVKGKSGK
jgi:hypothetical protein